MIVAVLAVKRFGILRLRRKYSYRMCFEIIPIGKFVKHVGSIVAVIALVPYIIRDADICVSAKIAYITQYRVNIEILVGIVCRISVTLV